MYLLKSTTSLQPASTVEMMQGLRVRMHPDYMINATQSNSQLVIGALKSTTERDCRITLGEVGTAYRSKAAWLYPWLPGVPG